MQFQTSQVADSTGILIITDISIPHEEYNPLSKIWSGLRKYIKRWAKVDIIGIFRYNDNSIKCIFYPNMAEAEHKNMQSSEYQSDFEQTFPKVTALLERTLKRFVLNPNGLQKYETILSEHQTGSYIAEPYLASQKNLSTELDGFFRNFLTTAGILTQEDNAAAIRKFLIRKSFAS